jgi:hypothetical protein
MKADFNATNKVIYGVWMLHNMQKCRLSRRRYTVSRTDCQMTALYQRSFFMILYGNFNDPLALHPSMQTTATIG